MRRRLTLIYLVLAFVVAAALSLSAYHFTMNLYRHEVQERLLDSAALMGESIFGAGFETAPGSMDGVAKHYTDLMALEDSRKYGGGGIRVTLIREDGVVIGDSEADSRTMQNHADRPEVRQAIELGAGSDERASSTVGTAFLYHARFFPEHHVVIRLAVPLAATRVILSGIARTSLFGMLVSLLSTWMLARIFSQYVTGPVVRLTRQVSNLTESDFNNRLQPPDDRELGALTKNVNVMAERLEQSIAALGDRNAKVDTIIRSLQNGLVAVDRTGRLIMVNPVMFGMFGLQAQRDVLGRPIVEVFRNRQLLEMMETAMQENRAEKREITTYEGGKRILEVSACPILPIDGASENIGALAHVADVTSVRKLEEMRSQFVSNVTHELKTPLTSIRGFVETLRSGALQDEAVAARFLDIIDIEADRLSTLIDDTLSLSEIEVMKQDTALTEFPVGPLAEEVAHMLAGAAEERHVILSIEVEEGFVLKANRNRIKQLLINLVDNAIKYNREGGSVTVRGHRREDGRAEIQVSDTGIGISEEFRERIFERFYRVDKGRTRSTGGTGLGLSIVKHIAQLYGGSVLLESEIGVGSTFTVIL